MFRKISNYFSKKYVPLSESVIISCFFNPQKSPYRLLAFQKWYNKIKHLDYRIVECVIGNDIPQLPSTDPNITVIRAESLLWHKEALLNSLIRDLPKKFKYIFWVDADVIFTNKNWLVNSVDQFKKFGVNILQPFDYCVHLEKNELKPSFPLKEAKAKATWTNRSLQGNKRLWRSFCASWIINEKEGGLPSTDYDVHGHVGFAWGARRDVLEECPLFDKALIGGADHIIAHAAVGEIPHKCIDKSFTDNLEEVYEWSRRFFLETQGRIGFVCGDLYHIWHGDIKDREYLKRIKEFTSLSKDSKKDSNGLYVGDDRYVKNYFKRREVTTVDYDFQGFDLGFYQDMGYFLQDVGNIFGSPYVEDESYPEPIEIETEQPPEPIEIEPVNTTEPVQSEVNTSFNFENFS